MTDTEKSTIGSSTRAKMLEIEQRKLEEKKRRAAQLAVNVEGKRGRKKGSRNKLTLLREAVLEKAEEMVLSDWEEVVENTLTLAKAGDTTCLKILWDRVIPSKRAIDTTQENKTPEIVINISGLQVKSVMGEHVPQDEDESIDADYEEVVPDGDSDG
jgi:hypothetical protein